MSKGSKQWFKSFTPAQLEIRRQRAKEWRRNNKERAVATLKAYKLTHPDKFKATAKKAIAKIKARNPKYSSKIVAKFFACRPWHKHYCYARSRCNPKTKNLGYRKYYIDAGILLKITSNEVKALWFRDNASLMRRPSLDRIYTAGNYSIGNCRFIEQAANASRRLNPDSELLAIERRKKRYKDRMGSLCGPPCEAPGVIRPPAQF